MSVRQQVLHLWLAESALDTPVVGWAFHDGTSGRGPALPASEPPYANGVAALEDGWCLLQSPSPWPLSPGAEHEIGYLPNEFLFERRIEVPDRQRGGKPR
jgi:hypothetical protein